MSLCPTSGPRPSRSLPLASTSGFHTFSGCKCLSRSWSLFRFLSGSRDLFTFVWTAHAQRPGPSAQLDVAGSAFPARRGLRVRRPGPQRLAGEVGGARAPRPPRPQLFKRLWPRRAGRHRDRLFKNQNYWNECNCLNRCHPPKKPMH